MKKPKNEPEQRTFFAASAADCTGLIPSLPADDDALEAYNQIYRIYPSNQQS